MAQRKRTDRPRRKPVQRKNKKSILSVRSLFRRKAVDFKPDPTGSGLHTKFHLTNAQKDRFMKWGGYILTCILMCMLQDVILSKIHFLGSTTDLVASAILLITVMEGVENGSVFVLLASMAYYFTGSAPLPWCILLLTFLGIGASMFRQVFLHRGLVAIVFCAGVALMLYEIGTCGIGLFQGLTHWGRIFNFLITGGLSWACMLALYPLIDKIGTIGGNIWKE